MKKNWNKPQQKGPLYSHNVSQNPFDDAIYCVSWRSQERTEVLWWVDLSVCLFARISQELHVQSLPHNLRVLPTVVARSCCGNVAICYELPVDWWRQICTKWTIRRYVDTVVASDVRRLTPLLRCTGCVASLDDGGRRSYRVGQKSWATDSYDTRCYFNVRSI